MVKVPGKTTVNSSEPAIIPNVMGFAPELIQMILDEHKLTTYRLGHKYDYFRIEDLITLQNSTSGQNVATARVTSKTQLKFKDLPLDLDNHESYRDKEHQRQVQEGYYAFIGRPIRDDDDYLRFEFALVEKL